jgi:hypothetical protein
MKKSMVVLALALALAGGACAEDVTESAEFQGIRQELADVEARLTLVIAERDAPAAHISTVRYEKASQTQALLVEMMENPEEYGTEDEWLDLVDTLAVPGTFYGDDVFGGIDWRSGWRNTMFGNVNATITTWHRWMSDDGSNAGSMWTWSGTAQNGEPFDLQGIEISAFDEEGLYTGVTVYYPYDDAEVLRRFAEGK